MTDVITVSELSVGFPRHDRIDFVIDQVSFSIEAGKTLALLGESGSGKSMTALSLMQLLPNTAAVYEPSRIELQDQSLFNLSESEMRKLRGKNIAMIFQEPMTALNPVMTVGKQIQESLLEHFRLNKKEARLKSIELLKDVGISDPEKRYESYPHQLSGGMKQRVMIAMALAGNPDLLIADEPTTALDVTIQAQVLCLIRSLQKKYRMALLFITHDLALARQLADDIMVMYQGRIVERASVDNFFRLPEQAYSQLLLKASLLQREAPANHHQENPLFSAQQIKVYFPILKGFFKRKVADIKAVDDVSLTLYRHKTLAIVGESGSGKTTLAKALMQLIPLTEGTVKLVEKNISNSEPLFLSTLRKTVQMVFQDPFSSMNPRMMIVDIIGEGIPAHFSAKEKKERTIDLLEDVGLPAESIFRYPHEFSGGQRQRIAIARALATEPSLLICDEPTSALDVSVQEQVLKLLKNLQQRHALSYLFITHNIAVVNYMADEVAVMYLGRIVEQGGVESVFNAPLHPYTQQLLKSVPSLEKPGFWDEAPLTGELPSPQNPPSGCHFHPRCPFAQEICKKSYPEPTLFPGNHWVRCHFPLK